MISFQTRLLVFLENHFGLNIRLLESVSILEKKFRLIKGTFRKNVDYDDAWLITIGLEAHNVFDVGCNIGQSTMLLMYPAHVEQIILVDPNPEALAQVAENLILNGLSGKARFICAFASDKPNEEKEFFTIGAGAAGSIYTDFAGTASKLGVSYFVPTNTLDNLSKEYQIIPDLVKIDVEGAELLVLNGSIEIAEKQITRFFVEMHSGPHISMAENADRILSWCNQYNYRAWYLKNKTELTEPEQIADRGRCHLLLLPFHMTFPSSLMPLEQGAPLEKVRLIEY